MLVLRTLFYGTLTDYDKKSTLAVWRRQDLDLSNRFMLTEYLDMKAGVERYEFQQLLDKAIVNKELNLSDYILNDVATNTNSQQSY